MGSSITWIRKVLFGGLCVAMATWTMVGMASSVSVNLSVQNVSAIVTDGKTFASGGVDGGGRAFSENLLGTSQTFNGMTFTLGTADAADAASNTALMLPSGQFTTLGILATAVNGNQAAQTFQVTFTDGSSQSFTQSISDWAHPQSFAGETIVATMAHRDISDGTTQTRTVNLYGYSFTLDSSKTVSTVTLPNTRNVVVLAMSMVPAANNLGNCGVVNGATYVKVFQSSLTEWCVESNFFANPVNQAAIPKFFAYGDAAIAQNLALFHITQPNQPFVIEVQPPFGGAHTGCDFLNHNYCDTVTGDAYTNVFVDSVNKKNIPGFFGFLLTLHESINVFTGLVSAGWPTDWWADHRSPFPNAMDEEFMRSIGTAQNNQTLIDSANAQHERFADPAQGGFDSEVAMDENFFNQFGGFNAYANTFRLVEGDGIHWTTVSPTNGTELLSEYVVAYLQLGFGTKSDLTATFTSNGVGVKDTTIASYKLNASNVAAIANAHCSIAGARNQGQNVSGALTALQQGNFQGAKLSAACGSTCPSECGCDSTVNQCVAPWQAR